MLNFLACFSQGRYISVGSLSFLTRIATPPAPYRSLPGPPGQESQKESPKSLPGPSSPRSKKCPKQSRLSLRSLKIDCFETPETQSRLFRTLFGPRGRKAPGDSLETRFTLVLFSRLPCWDFYVSRGYLYLGGCFKDPPDQGIGIGHPEYPFHTD